LITLPKIFWPRVLSSVVIQLYAGGCTPSVDRALSLTTRKLKFAYHRMEEQKCVIMSMTY